MKIGISVDCLKCGQTKAPRGRSVPDMISINRCTWDKCTDYYNDPKPGDLWPGETEEDFGFPCSINATKEI